MSVHSTVDRETFQWVKLEVDSTLTEARKQLKQYDDNSDKEALFSLTNNLHQVVGSLQMLELASLSTLVMETELLIDDYAQGSDEIKTKVVLSLVKDSIATILSSLDKIDNGLPENPIEIVELINQIRAARGLDAVEISALFSPNVEVFPEVTNKKPLVDADYKARAKALRVHFQSNLLKWLRDGDNLATERLGIISEKLYEMSTFGAVARLWWVTSSYVDYVKNHELKNRHVHGRIFRRVDDLLRKLEQQGESALVRDSGDELIKVMLFYTGVGTSRTERMDEVAKAFSLNEYFPGLDRTEITAINYKELRQELIDFSKAYDLPVGKARQLISQYFDDVENGEPVLDELIEHAKLAEVKFDKADLTILSPIVEQAGELIRGLRSGKIEPNDDNGFHLAAAVLFVENTLTHVDSLDEYWVQAGELKLNALTAINSHQEVTSDMDGSHLSGSERKALLSVVSSEVEQNLSDIESRLEAFSKDPKNGTLISGIDGNIRQVRGALQLLGEHKVGLLLQMTEDQFKSLESGESAATPALIEALAIAVGTMEDYVKGLQSDRAGMDEMLDRSITDLEVSIGKKVSRGDVEDLLGKSSDSLFSWLGDQSDFALFTDLKSHLRDLLTLSKKTGLNNVEELVKEQTRLVDLISQEPAFLTENITNNLQNNMGNIVSEIIQLYGTEDTEEELQSDAELLEKKAALKADDGPQFHDDMDVEALDDDLKAETETEGVTATQLGKQHAATNKISAEDVDESILEIFIEESTEVLADAKSLYKACEEDNNDRDSIRELRRGFHTLKGSSRMVGLNDIGEVAWFTESLFNYVLDTGKPLTKSVLDFANDAIQEFDKHLAEEYKNQHLVDVAAWGARTEAVSAAEAQADASPSDEQEQVEEPEKSVEETIELTLNEDVDSGLPVDESAAEEKLDSEILEFTATEGEVDFEDVDAISFNEDSQFHEASTASFSVIDDEEMRQVFVKEATTNIENIEQNLKRDPLEIGEDDPLSISTHTLLGNSRTLGLNPVSSAFEEAEKICLTKAESRQAFTSEEVKKFKELVALTKHCVESESEEPPYFDVDDQKWDELSEQLHLLAENAQEHQFDVEEVAELEESSLELDGADTGDEASSRVAAVFEGMESVDDLMLDDEQDDQPTVDLSDVEEIDLDQISLNDNDSNLDGVDSDNLDLSDQLSEVLSDDIELSDSDEIEMLSESDDALSLEDSDTLNLETETPSLEIEGLSLESNFDSDGTEANEVSTIETSDEEELALELDGLSFTQNDKENQVEAADTDSIEVSEPEIVEAPVAEEASESELPVSGSSTPDRSVEFEGGDIDQELQEIFVEELKNIQHDFDDEVAKLVDLASTPEAMANIMRHLHTIKGSSLMAEANSLGELTHQTETFLEGNFIRNADELREVRETLELYTETLQEAGEAYEEKGSYKIPGELLSRLGLATEQTVDLKEIEQSMQSAEVVEVEEDEHDLSSFDIDHTLTKIATDVQNIHAHWISASKWGAVKTDYLAQNTELKELLDVAEELGPLTGFVTSTDDFVNQLSFDDDDDHESAKSLLEEVYDVINSNARAIISGSATEDTADLEAQMSAILLEKTASEKEQLVEQESEDVSMAPETTEEAEATIDIEIPVEDSDVEEVEETEEQEAEVEEQQEATVESELEKNQDKADSKETEIFVPGSVEVDEQEQKNTERQEKAAKARAAALRIRTETLDSLTNFVGDASMNRSQMREDVLSVKTVVDDLYNNVIRFSQQLRELEMEADSKITARSNETLSKDRGEEFDPLEMDRYTKLQQLSRGLTENLDELSNIQSSLSSFVYRAETSLQKQDRLNRELQDEIMQVRLVTFGGVGPQLRQVVRRTAREVGKKVDLQIVGAEVKLDKTILDGIVPALEHMLRNGVDHGIEMPAERVAKGKSETGKIVVECRQVAREIIVSVKDDGGGLDLEKIRKKAVKENMLAEGEPIKPEDVMIYLTQSGFSTADKLTKISGRGVGMDVVQDSLRRMSGSINYEPDNTQPGSCFTIKLPISLAVSSAMFVESAGVQYAISARSIDRIVNEEADDLRELLKGDKPILKVGDDFYALIDLADYLGYETRIGDAEEKLPVVLVTAGVQNIAVIVDELLDTQEIVVKGLGGHLGRIPIFGGATIRADGSVVLLVDMVGISYYESQITLPETHGDDATSIPDIMVVDDSLTVRKSAERDISAMGINSVLAKDGLDAQQQLKAGFVPDMILLDIEMPRMDGFELLEWVKSEDDLKHIPVVMISSRATEKHIDKATELGCTAFLGKPYLLESLIATFNQHLKLDSPIELDKK